MIACKKCGLPLDRGGSKKVTCPRCMSDFIVSEKNGKTCLKILKKASSDKKDKTREKTKQILPLSDFTGETAFELPSVKPEKSSFEEPDKSVFFKAVRLDEIKNIKFLLKTYPAFITSIDEKGETPLHAAVRTGRSEVAKLLIGKRASVDSKNNDGLTPLHMAVRKGWRNIIELLLKNGAYIDIKDNSGNTPLHIAADKGAEKAVLLLLEKGADINAGNKDGERPLHRAAIKKNKSLINLLIREGADINLKDNDGLTCMDYEN